MLDHNTIELTAFQTIAYDLAVTTPQGLNVFKMKTRFRTGGMTYKFLEIGIHSELG
jgi:hypothetical protein